MIGSDIGMLPQDAVIFFMHANYFGKVPYIAVAVDLVEVEIMNFTQTVATKS